MKDKFSEWLKKIQKVHPKADEEVLRFIYDFSVKQGYGEAEDVLYQQFASGYCYYFACMLKAAFNRGKYAGRRHMVISSGWMRMIFHMIFQGLMNPKRMITSLNI